jgi:NitT/TauT family transport system ATP-binding protein
MSEDYADQTLHAVVSWACYGEVFAYDEGAGVFSLESPS